MSTTNTLPKASDKERQSALDARYQEVRNKVRDFLCECPNEARVFVPFFEAFAMYSKVVRSVNGQLCLLLSMIAETQQEDIPLSKLIERLANNDKATRQAIEEYLYQLFPTGLTRK
jgi:hypothetical protein